MLQKEELGRHVQMSAESFEAKAENCSEIVQELNSPYSAMGCSMSLKVLP